MVVVLVIIAAAVVLAASGSRGNEPGQAESAGRLEQADGRPAAANIVADDFERASLGPAWKVHFGSPGIVGGSDLGLLSGTFALLSSAVPVSADQFSEAQVAAGADDVDKGVFVRRRASDGARYQLHYDTNGTDAEPRPHWQIKYDGVPTQETRILSSTLETRAPVAGDVLRLEAEGRELRGYLNGKLVLAAEDAAISTGTAGVALLELDGVTTPKAVVERWSGGRLPRILELGRSGSLSLSRSRPPACFSVRVVPSTRSQVTFTVLDENAAVVWKLARPGAAGQARVVQWCGRANATAQARGKRVRAGRYRARLEVFAVPAGGPRETNAFFARTWQLRLRA